MFHQILSQIDCNSLSWGRGGGKHPLFPKVCAVLLFGTCNYCLYQTNPTGKIIGQNGKRFNILEFLNGGAIRSLRPSHPALIAHNLGQNSIHHLFDPSYKINNKSTCVQGMPSPAYFLLPAYCIPPVACSSWGTVTYLPKIAQLLRGKTRINVWSSVLSILVISGSLLIYMDRTYE